jgi:hypothetical protein
MPVLPLYFQSNKYCLPTHSKATSGHKSGSRVSCLPAGVSGGWSAGQRYAYSSPYLINPDVFAGVSKLLS